MRGQKYSLHNRKTLNVKKLKKRFAENKKKKEGESRNFNTRGRITKDELKGQKLFRTPTPEEVERYAKKG